MKTTIALPFLFLALSPMADAALFVSMQTGDWGDPATWVGAAGFPETYTAGDSATVDPGHTVSYDGSASAPLGGNLLVAAGNQITITKSTLIQTWIPGAVPLFGTAIGIGVSHPLSGVGKLDINDGGVFDSGTANVVVVGIANPALGGAVGDGTVNINDGIFLLNAGAGAGGVGALGLAVGIDDGGLGTVNVGDGVDGSARLDLLTNNALLTIGGQNATGIGGKGTVNVRTDGALAFGSESINLGESGGIGTLNVEGSLVGTAGGVVRVGRDGGGVMTVSNPAANVNVGQLGVGTIVGGAGSLDISAGTVAMTRLGVAGLEGGGRSARP